MHGGASSAKWHHVSDALVLDQGGPSFGEHRHKGHARPPASPTLYQALPSMRRKSLRPESQSKHRVLRCLCTEIFLISPAKMNGPIYEAHPVATLDNALSRGEYPALPQSIRDSNWVGPGPIR